MDEKINSSLNNMPSDAKVFLVKAKAIIDKKEPNSNEIEELRKLYEALNKKYNIDENKKQSKIGVMIGKVAHKFNNIYWINYTRDHRKAFQETEKKLLGYNTKEGLNHDKDKEIMYHLFPAPIAHAIHTQTARHHKKGARTTNDYKQMVIDWECSRLTKPDKQLKPYQVMEKFYPDLKDIIIPILKEFNLPTCAAEDKDDSNIKTLTKEQKGELLNMKKRILKESTIDIRLSIYEAEMNNEITKEERVALFDELNYLIEKTSTKEQNRMNKFLKEHNYDPKTKTIEIDEKDKNGKKKRVKFNITNGPVFDDSASSGKEKIENSSINMPRKTLKRKPMISHGVFKHEEGHIVDKFNPGRYDKIRDNARKAIDNDIHNEKEYHGNDPNEYVADVYSALHNKYGINGFNKMINAMKADCGTVEDIIKDMRRKYKSGVVGNYFVTESRKDINRCKKELRNIKKKRKEILESIIGDIRKCTDNERRRQLINMKNELNNEYAAKIQYYERQMEKLVNVFEKNLSWFATDEDLDKYIDHNKDRLKKNDMKKQNEIALRQKFVNDNVKEFADDIKLSIYEAEMNGDISKDEMYELLILTENI